MRPRSRARRGGRRGSAATSRRLLQERLDPLHEERLVDRAPAGRGDPALAIEHDGLRVADNLEALQLAPVLIAQMREVELVLPNEVLRVAGHVEHVHADDRGPLRLETRLPAREDGRLGLARAAPRGPEV